YLALYVIFKWNPILISAHTNGVSRQGSPFVGSLRHLFFRHPDSWIVLVRQTILSGWKNPRTRQVRQHAHLLPGVHMWSTIDMNQFCSYLSTCLSPVCIIPRTERLNCYGFKKYGKPFYSFCRHYLRFKL